MARRRPTPCASVLRAERARSEKRAIHVKGQRFLARILNALLCRAAIAQVAQHEPKLSDCTCGLRRGSKQNSCNLRIGCCRFNHSLETRRALQTGRAARFLIMPSHTKPTSCRKQTTCRWKLVGGARIQPINDRLQEREQTHSELSTIEKRANFPRRKLGLNESS